MINTLILGTTFNTVILIIYIVVILLADIFFIYFSESNLILDPELLDNSLNYELKLIDKAAKKEAREKADREYRSSESSYDPWADVYANGKELKRIAWIDIRNNDPLYRDSDGKVVNSRGEEVPIAYRD